MIIKYKMGGCCEPDSTKSEFQEPKDQTIPPSKSSIERRQKTEDLRLVNARIKQNIQNIGSHDSTDPTFTLQVKKVIETLCIKFQVVQNIQIRLQKVIYSSKNLSSLADEVISTIILLDNDKQNQEDKSVIKQFFSPSITQQVKQDKLYFDDVLESIQKAKMNSQKINYAQNSRIYHTIANLKAKEVQKKYTNEFKVRCKLDKSYKILAEDELSQVVNLQVIAEHISELAKKVDFQFKEISEQSDQMIFLLYTTFKHHEKTIENLKYDLNEKQVLEMGKITREGCDYNSQSVFLLLTYFVKARNKIMEAYEQQSQQQKVATLQKKMQALINSLHDAYPPGSKLQENDQTVKKNLESLEMQGEKKGKFEYQSIILKEDDKAQQLKDIIIHYAQIAKDNKSDFERLIRNTCLDKCISFKLGLKLDPNHPNPKAVIRIQEKMLFKKSQPYERQKATSVKDVLEGEQERYQEKIKSLLREKEKFTFTVDDMVRGKCIFLSIEDIIETVREIKRFAEENKQHFRIIEIQNRFNRPVPISDVTLKIVLNEAIIAELQLTLQTNAATYSFSHKIYELHRSKIFSKIKMVDNYYQEYRKEFIQLVDRCLKLKQGGLNVFDPSLHPAISKYFEIEKQLSLPELPHFLEKSLESASQKKKVKGELKECLVSDNQEFMATVFEIYMSVPERQRLQKDKQIGQLSNSIFNRPDQSVWLKSVLLQQIYKNISLTSLTPRLRSFASQFAQTQTKRKENGQNTYKQGIFMEEYLNCYFKIDQNTLRQLTKQTAKVLALSSRINNYVQVYLEWSNWKKHFVGKFFKVGRVAVDAVSGQLSQANISFLRETAESLQSQGQFQLSQQCIDWLASLIQKIPLKQTSSVLLQVELIQVRLKIKRQQYSGVQSTLKSLKEEFKAKQQFKKVAECDLWLILCSYRINKDLEKYKKAYSNYQKFCKAQCLQPKAAECADQEWLLAEAILENTKDQNHVLKTHYRQALVEYSSFLPPSDLLPKMKTVWQKYSKNGIAEPTLNENKNIVSAYLQPENLKQVKFLSKYCLPIWPNLSTLTLGGEHILKEQCAALTREKWGYNLAELNLAGNRIGHDGALNISLASWNQLKKLNLAYNDVGSKGIQFLSFIDRPQLLQLNLEQNNIGAEGCEWLSGANWPNLTKLNLDWNSVGPEGCMHLSQADWQNLTQLNLDNNNVLTKGCEYLKSGQWFNLQHLSLNSNSIDQEGCLYLMNGEWPNLSQLKLGSNSVGVEGCSHLSKAYWPNLTVLKLNLNSIDVKGCQNLSKGNWPNLTDLDITGNQIGDEGCLHLSKTKWSCLTELNLEWNNISTAGCLHLSNANWPSLALLNLTLDLKGASTQAMLTGHLQLNQIYQTIPSVKRAVYISAKQNGPIYHSQTYLPTKLGQKGVNIQVKRTGPIQPSFIWNNIDSEGCLHLSKANWPNLTHINLASNGITSEGCLHLNKVNWRDLTYLNLGSNSIGSQGLLQLSNSDWPYLTYLKLDHNQIGDQGCQLLDSVNWPYITQIILNDNSIGAGGSKHLSNANYPNLAVLYLGSNKIGHEGCLNLVSANWPHLAQLNLQFNNVGDSSKLKQLLKQKWPHAEIYLLN